METMETMETMTNPNQHIVELGKQFAEKKYAYEAAKLKADEANEAWSKVEAQLMEAMRDAQVTSIKIDRLGLFVLKNKSRPSVNKANKPKFLDYLRKSGNGDLIQEDVNANTLSSFIRDHEEVLSQEFQTRGLDPWQLMELAGYAEPHNDNNVLYPFAGRFIANQPLDKMDADECAKALLKSQGATMFSEPQVAFTAVKLPPKK